MSFEASEDIMTKFKSQGLYIIKIKYWNASRSGSPPSLIPTLWNIGILHYKQAKLPKHLQHSVYLFIFCRSSSTAAYNYGNFAYFAITKCIAWNFTNVLTVLLYFYMALLNINLLLKLLECWCTLSHCAFLKRIQCYL